jgi:hypothetical protein
VVDDPLATARIAWLIGVFDPLRPSALRRWVRGHAARAVPDMDLLNALVLVVNEAVTLAGEAASATNQATVELWRGPEALRFLVASAAVLPALSRTEPPTDDRLRALWLSLQVNDAIEVSVTRHGAGSHITITLPV